MKTTRLKKGWNAIVLGALIFGAIALVAIVGAVNAQQNSTVQNTANASGANSTATVVPTAQDEAPLLDAWDRAEALHWHGTATPTEEMLPLDTLGRATPSPQNNAHAQATETPLLDAIDRAEALKHK
jgi:hypothetical protein